MLLLIEGLYHPNGLDIFLYHVVQFIVGMEDLLEQGHDLPDDADQPHCQDGQADKEDHGDPGIDPEGRRHGEDQHEGRADHHTGHHLVGHLDIGHIRGQPGDDGAR